MGGLLHLVQRGSRSLGGLRSRPVPPRCTKCNSTRQRLVYQLHIRPIWCDTIIKLPLHSKGLTDFSAYLLTYFTILFLFQFIVYPISSDRVMRGQILCLAACDCNKWVSRTDTNPPFAYSFSTVHRCHRVSTGRVKKLHTLLVSLYF